MLEALLISAKGPCEASSIVLKTLNPGDIPALVGNNSRYSEIVIVDESGVCQPPGVAGQILVKGETVFQGYLHQSPEEGLSTSVTKLGQVVSGPWYRTGDIGYINEDGQLYLQGRLDNQVKVNGQVSLLNFA